jgi:hypothetical protein
VFVAICAVLKKPFDFREKPLINLRILPFKFSILRVYFWYRQIKNAGLRGVFAKDFL